MTDNERMKKSGNPTQPGHRSSAQPTNRSRSKRMNILQRKLRKYKGLRIDRILILVAAGVAVVALTCHFLSGVRETRANDVHKVETTAQVMDVYFFQGDGVPVDMAALTDSWAAEAGFSKRYDLTDYERWEIASVITAEAIGEPYAGKVAVAQCMLQSCEDDGIRPVEMLRKYGYAKGRPEPTDEALRATAAVFDFGQVATTEPIKYFYAPAVTASNWHETQVHVMTINGHKFFKEAK